MRGIVVAIAMTMIAVLGAGSTSGGAAAAPGEQAFVVVYKPRIQNEAQSAAKTTALERRAGFISTQRFATAVRGFAAQLAPSDVSTLRADPDVAYVVPDRRISAVPSVTPVKKGEFAPTGIQRIFGTFNGRANPKSNAKIAVLDTGVQTGNPDISAKTGKNCVAGRGSTNDDEGHGTHVAGTVVGKNNGKGVIGMSPGSTAVAVKVLDSNGDGTLSSIICGLEWVVANAKKQKIAVVNMSLGGPGSTDNNCGYNNSDPFHLSVCNVVNAGVSVVVAAGNEGVDFAGSTPAAYPEVLTVTAMADSDGARGGVGGTPGCDQRQQDDTAATFSNYATSAGAQAHTIAAPGSCIVSTFPRNQFAYLSGTSMAAPHVAGAVALCIDRAGKPGPCAGMSPAQIISKMRSDAATRPADYGFAGDPNRPYNGRYYGNLVVGYAGP